MNTTVGEDEKSYEKALVKYFATYVKELGANFEASNNSLIDTTQAAVLSDIMSDILAVMDLLHEEGVCFEIEELDIMTRAENLKERLLNNFKEEGEEED